MKIRLPILLVLPLTTAALAQPSRVVLQKTGEAYRLLRNDQPYFIQGAVGSDYLEKLKRYGGNSIRTGSHPAGLNRADSLGLTALVNLPVRAERDGMNYDDTAAVRKQHERVMDIVRKTKDHPAVLMWALGNELDFIQANEKDHYNLRVWDAVNALTKEIHRVDPNHPVMTVVGSINAEKIQDLNRRCPDLDLLGINEYGDLDKIPSWLRRFGWQKPYAVTEWGPTGFWQVPKTPWKAPVEETSSVKADQYRKRYETAIRADRERCLGSYVFLWRQHQERTHTWFGMFDAEGLETEAVDVMHYEWTGRWPANRTPRLDSVRLNGRTAFEGIYLKPGQPNRAQVWVTDPEGDPIRYRWEILREGTSFPYGGNGEKRPPAIPGLIDQPDTARPSFRAPREEGAYRLFVYAYDGRGHWATANLPFFVRKE
ncbi:glycoside hydrolase family 2 TIM barrel-domain containing protein [Larkinella soli]|uniref:glycoside hydrolase family 2 TIM barrel-domain containing protein n=1 Tax=Larkinella soli TaxID=1770527 RepID=UPI000FFC865A|nr:glycoside hydrolase family 2 TIM barrel-domain containing protein [Larkinella soli]